MFLNVIRTPSNPEEPLWLNLKWIIYKDYFENPQRRALLTDTAPVLFAIFQKLLLDDIALTLCRITDPAKTKIDQNNTLYQLLSIKGITLNELDNLKKELQPLRDIRNKFIAHSDLDKTLNYFLNNTSESVNTTGELTRSTTLSLNFPLNIKNIDEVIQKINRIINVATKKNMRYEIILNQVPFEGIESLIYLLKIAHFYKTLEETNKLERFEDFLYEEWQKFEYKDA